jgi:pyruvate ferredoxin oxidoreductase beta subunit/2-oxoisovalerate ferredoxin oxidoreductase beta subunit
MSQIPIKDLIPDVELMSSGHLACPGCGGSISMRLVLKALGPKTIVTLPACCWTIVAGPYPQSTLSVPLFHTAFETAAAAASGIRAALDMKGDTDTTVVAWAGDGGTFDIGLQALSGAAERNENILYVCYDNEAYMNTGIQRSSSTPWGAWTTTTPAGTPKSHPKKDMLAILAAHGIPYGATASIAYPGDLVAKVTKAKGIQGTRFLHILSPCPPGWKTSDEETIDLARMAVLNRVFPLMEVEDGQRWRFTMDHPGDPVEPYIRRQGRFRHLTDEQITYVQSETDARWKVLQGRVQHGT